jgi:hypothetical protein
MNRETVVCMSRVAGLLAQIKGKVAEQLKDNPDAYNEIRNLLGDCQEILAIHCDCAPIRLIAGHVDEIMENKDALYQQN